MALHRYDEDVRRAADEIERFSSRLREMNDALMHAVIANTPLAHTPAVHAPVAVVAPTLVPTARTGRMITLDDEDT